MSPGRGWGRAVLRTVAQKSPGALSYIRNSHHISLFIIFSFVSISLCLKHDVVNHWCCLGHDLVNY